MALNKLTSALGSLDTSGLGNIAQMLGGGSSSVLSKGTSLLGSLFGDSMVSGLASTLGRVAGVNSGIAKSLLGYLMPLVLGKVATQWKNEGGTAHALKSLFAGQRDNIEAAVPAGFSLADIPEASDFRKPAYGTARNKVTEPVTAKSPAAWLIPAALALLGGFFLWHFLSGPKANQVAAEKSAAPVRDLTSHEVTAMKPVLPDSIDVPNLDSVRGNLGNLFKSLNTSLADVKDAASAERALPALEELNTKIDSASQILARLPAASTRALRPLIEQQLKDTTEKAKALSSIDGISARFKTLLQQIVDKVTKWISADNR